MSKSSNIVYYGLAVLSLKGISLIMMPIVTRYLSVSDYGMLNFLVSIASMLSIILSFGLSELLYRFNDFEDKKRQHIFYKACLKIALFSAGICLTTSVFLVDFVMSVLPTQVSTKALSFLFINLGGSVVLSLPLAILRIHGEAKKYMLVAVSQGVLQAICTVLLLELGMGVDGVMLSGAIVVWLLLVLLAFRYKTLLLTKLDSDNVLTKEHSYYIFSITLASVFSYGLNGAENWFLVSFEGKETLAVYFIATQFALVASIAFEPFRLWWFPQRFNIYKSNQQKAADIPLYGLAYALVIVITMMTVGPYVIDLLLPKAYEVSKNILPWLCVVFFIKTVSELLNLGCYYKNNASAAPVINGISACLAVVLTYVSLKHFDLYTMLYALILVHAIRALLFIRISQSLVSLSYKYKYLILMFALLMAQTLLVSHHNEIAIIFFIVGTLLVLSFTIYQRKQLLLRLRG
ncbi:lipopolysaccharide biosynthesis protein [Pseudoalteromonas phenolica]|uniref:lipopolysaccharide biosynthesis protein n=1 Tax=Pseudoalteromonas phenolica TaxID=161398 RepID=UPI00110AEDC7|nr:lipopolysaccharide biosynthesis protein [Pseudoalteromonas phenolica]TMO56729.1 hypothetical protein CWC21_06025 [Pseudoalteromonas phenolica]